MKNIILNKMTDYALRSDGSLFMKNSPVVYVSGSPSPHKFVILNILVSNIFLSIPIFRGDNLLSLINWFNNLGFYKTKNILNTNSFRFGVDLARVLVSNGNLYSVTIEFKGRLMGSDRKEVESFSFVNPKVIPFSTKTLKTSFSRDKFGTVGGTMVIVAPFDREEAQLS